MIREIHIGKLRLGPGAPLTVVTGPCVIESEDAALFAADFLQKAFEKTQIQWIFKSSYDKANRLSLNSFRGPGLQEGLRILQRIRQEFDIPIFTDVHSVEEARAAGAVCDVIQIPAFLCRQTDILLAAGATEATVNIKKGQFMSPWDMRGAIEKVASMGNPNILLTERGTSFGYNNLVSDMRSIPILQGLGYPVLYDATHSVQLPGAGGGYSSGQREFIPILSRAALAAGVNGIFAESHENPARAPSDAAAMLSFAELPALLQKWQALYELIQEDAECCVSA